MNENECHSFRACFCFLPIFACRSMCWNWVAKSAERQKWTYVKLPSCPFAITGYWKPEKARISSLGTEDANVINCCPLLTPQEGESECSSTYHVFKTLYSSGVECAGSPGLRSNRYSSLWTFLIFNGKSRGSTACKRLGNERCVTVRIVVQLFPGRI